MLLTSTLIFYFFAGIFSFAIFFLLRGRLSLRILGCTLGALMTTLAVSVYFGAWGYDNPYGMGVVHALMQNMFGLVLIMVVLRMISACWHTYKIRTK